jgi:hypothetical protein
MGNRRRESSVQGVLGDRDLLGCVLGFVGGQTGRQSVRALGQTALVCRKWKEVSAREELWVGIENEVVPALWREEQGGRVVAGRGRLVQYGRLLVAERRMWSGEDWSAGLELQVEVFDRMDGLQMLSARGALEAKVQGNVDSVVLCMVPPGKEVRGWSFSAASRDPVQQRFADIEAYFTQGHESGYPCSLCVRVTVRDRRTGRGGLLWEEGKSMVRTCPALIPFWEQRLPAGSKVAVSNPNKMVWGGGDGLQCKTNLYVCPIPDQHGVAEKDRMYRVATRACNSQRDRHPFSFMVSGTDIAKVGSMIRWIVSSSSET